MEISLFSPKVKLVSASLLAFEPAKALATVGTNKNTHGLRAYATYYADELIVAACIFLLVISSIIGVFYRTPVYGGKPLPRALKLPICITGGFCAFLFCLHQDQALTLITPIYVGCGSFIAPAIIHLIHAVLIKHFGMKFGLSEEMLEPAAADSIDGP